MKTVFSVEIAVTLSAGRRLTDDEITDVIELIVDSLDELELEPSIGSVRAGDDVELTVSVAIDEREELDALARAVTATRTAFRSAGIGTARLGAARDIRSQVRPLQAA